MVASKGAQKKKSASVKSKSAMGGQAKRAVPVSEKKSGQSPPQSSTASEHQFWADRMADDVIARVESDPRLQKIVSKNGYFVYDEKTPSGEIHIGSGRGWVIHDVLAKVLRSKGKKSRFVLSSDDFDPFDKSIKGKPEWDRYLGVPFRNIPSPVEGFTSWADYYFRQATGAFKEYGIEAELESTGGQYINGTFNAAIKKVLDNAGKVAAIFERTYNKPYNKLPFSPICEQCGKIGTTLATGWDSKKELVTYQCKEDLVQWAKGCGHVGQVSPYDGNGKLPWKVEWAAKWPSKQVVVELAGKDHFTLGGSRTIAIAICHEVLDYPPPYPSTATETGSGYEFFNIGGKKMSTSRGMGVGFADIAMHIPHKILRFMMVSYKPYAVIDFDPSRPNDLLLIYDRYDTCERVYYGREESDRKEELSRVYEFSHVGKMAKEFPPQVSLRHAAVVVQIAGEDDGAAVGLVQASGHAPMRLSEEAKEYLSERFAAARSWLREFAGENDKFQVQQSVSAQIRGQLGDRQKKAIHLLIDRLEEKAYTDKELHEAFYDVAKNAGLEPSDFFRAVYLVVLAKERGPRLASFLLALGKEKVVALLRQAVE